MTGRRTTVVDSWRCSGTAEHARLSAFRMNAVFGGLFTSRINLNRERKHGYTAAPAHSSSSGGLPDSSWWRVACASLTRPPRAPETVKELRAFATVTAAGLIARKGRHHPSARQFAHRKCVTATMVEPVPSGSPPRLLHDGAGQGIPRCNSAQVTCQGGEGVGYSSSLVNIFFIVVGDSEDRQRPCPPKLKRGVHGTRRRR